MPASPASNSEQKLEGGPFTGANLLLVSGYRSNAIHVFDLDLGEPVLNIEPVLGAQSIVRGPAGFLYAVAEDAHQVLRIDPHHLTIEGPFVWDDPATPQDENGGLDGPTAAIFGPDGNLYVSSFNTDEILRFDGGDGKFLDVFIPAGTGGLDGPDAGMVFGPEGDLYVPSFYSNNILRFDGRTGASLGEFIASEPGALLNPRAILFASGLSSGEACALVASAGNGLVNRYNLAGEFQGTLARVPAPYCLAFLPGTPELFVSSVDSVQSVDGESGLALGTPIPAGKSGLSAATFHFFLVP